MTPDEDEYRFELDAYTPQTIPMDRLAEYMAAIAALLTTASSSAYVHFARLVPGSTGLVARVRSEAIIKVEERVQAAPLAEKGTELWKAFNRVDTLAREDNASATLNRRRSGVKTEAKILYFPGRERPKPQRIGPFTQPAVIDGIAIRAGGETLETANVLIQLDDGRVVSGEVSKALAQEIGLYLYRVPLRFQGDARWQRAESGDWELLRLKVRSFLPLSNDTLSDALERIRAIGGSDWEKADDPLKLLREDRADQSKR